MSQCPDCGNEWYHLSEPCPSCGLTIEDVADAAAYWDSLCDEDEDEEW